MHADCGATEAKHCGELSGRYILTGLLCLILMVGYWSYARADGDIVYAAEYFRLSGQYYKDPNGGKPIETLESVAPSHLYRINPDGSGRKQLTFGDLDGQDYNPLWSPDGKSVLFQRRQATSDAENYTVCLIGANGGAIRRLLQMSKEGDYSWSPDGRRIVVYARDYEQKKFILHVIDVQTGADRQFPVRMVENGNITYAWSPDGRRLFLCQGESRVPECHLWSPVEDRMIDVPTPVESPLWLDNQTIIGDLPLRDNEEQGASSTVIDSLRVISDKGHELRRIPLRLARRLKKDEEDDFFYSRRYHRIPGTKALLFAETLQGMSDGKHYSCHLIDLSVGTRRLLYEGRLVGISPDGTRFVTAAEEWVGPYKRGGARVGALTIVSLKTGKAKAISSPLIKVSGGDWRNTTSRIGEVSHQAVQVDSHSFILKVRHAEQVHMPPGDGRGIAKESIPFMAHFLGIIIGKDTTRTLEMRYGRCRRHTGSHPHSAREWLNRTHRCIIGADGTTYLRDNFGYVIVDTACITRWDAGVSRRDDAGRRFAHVAARDLAFMRQVRLGMTYNRVLDALKRDLPSPIKVADTLSYSASGYVYNNKYAVYRRWNAKLTFMSGRLSSIRVSCE